MAKIKEIHFKMVSPEMIRKLSVMPVVTSEVYGADAYPIEGGVMDPKLGIIDPGMRCQTCGGRIGECTGHFGHIELARPVINILYLSQIRLLLSYTCHKCGALLADKSKLEAGAAIKKLKILSTCPDCGAKQGKIKLEKPSTFVRDKHPLTPIEIREQFEKISDETSNLIGIRGGRPEWFILTLMLVPPVTARPSITLESGDRSEDDLTHKLVDVIRINHRLADNLEIGAPDFIIEDLWELLQYHVTTYFNNEISSIPPARHRSGRSLKTLAQRLKSKDGRFRHNLTGKRVNYCARTVVSPDPNISLNEVGIPTIIARELTVPTKVTKENIEQIKTYVMNGPEVHPGANYVTRPDGIRKKIIEENKESVVLELTPGYMIERHLMDGDVVLFNRQPSLHRMSVMAHYARIMPDKTFRLNLCVCKPYNADFDGDEMNLHVPQTAEARSEAEQLMLVEQNIRSPRFGGPIMGCDQDYISGAYMLTKSSTRFTKKETAQILTNADITADLTKDIYTGKEMFSFAIPKGIDLEYKATVCRKCEKCKKGDCEHDAYVIIENGELKKGVVDSNGIAAFKGRILDTIDIEKGHTSARIFIDQVTKIIAQTLMKLGFSISLDNLDTDKETQKNIELAIKKQLDIVDKLIEDYKKGNIDVSPGRTPEETLEDLIMIELWRITNMTQKIIDKSVDEDSSAIIMARTGARGSIQNLAYMSGLVGQEAIRGRRVFRGYTGRTLAHFKKGDLGPYAHGFVRSSFVKGITPIEFFYEVMKGREGIMDSSLKTRVSGYMQRRLVSALQDIKVGKDYHVRDSSGTIIQFMPGEDGIDPAKSDGGYIDKAIMMKHKSVKK
ncbi:MAG: DNA-directed RNA polymerase subunit A' [archaeon]